LFRKKSWLISEQGKPGLDWIISIHTTAAPQAAPQGHALAWEQQTSGSNQGVKVWLVSCDLFPSDRYNQSSV